MSKENIFEISSIKAGFCNGIVVVCTPTLDRVIVDAHPAILDIQACVDTRVVASWHELLSAPNPTARH